MHPRSSASTSLLRYSCNYITIDLVDTPGALNLIVETVMTLRAEFPVVACRVAVYDGSHHAVDSSEMAFKIAASMGFKKALEAAHPVLLEPLMRVEVEAPADHIGNVIGDLNARRGRILHVEAKGQTEQITALVPMAELLTYATMLNSLTAGCGSFAMEFSRYDEVPRKLAVRIIETHKVETHPAAH